MNWDALESYRESRRIFLRQKEQQFPLPCVVRVDSPRFFGTGIVWTYDGIADYTDSLLVLLENGNTWDYPIDCCARIEDEVNWPQWIKDDFAERRKVVR
jgi:hypothetical protein